MIERKTIKLYVKTQSSLVEEVFCCLVNNKSSVTQSFLTKSGKRAIKKTLILNNVKVLPTENWFQDIAKRYSLEELLVFLEQEVNKKERSLFYFLKDWLDSMRLKALAFTLDLDLSALSQEELDLVGRAILLASIHQNL